MATNQTFKESALRVVAVLGLIAVLLLGAWGIIQIAFALPSFFGGLGERISGIFTHGASAERISLSVPAQITSGGTFGATWQHQGGSGEYSYALSYSCAEHLTVATALPNGSWQQVPCNTPFNYINATGSVPVAATITGSSATPVTFKVTATKLSTGNISASATGITTVSPASGVSDKPAAAQSAASTKPSSTYTPSGRTSNLYGYPDLSVRILTNPGSVRAGSRVALQFEITNTGTNAATGWSFNATLPYNPTYTYSSGVQQTLYPGDKIVYTLGYDAVQGGSAYTYTNNNGGCTSAYNPGYPYATYNYTYGYTYPCATNYAGGYDWSATCNNYGPCNIPGYQNKYQYGYTGYPYTLPGYGAVSGYSSYWGSGAAQTATIAVDPYNRISELNKSNNTASVSYQVY